MSGFKGTDHGWRGGGRFRVARIDGTLLVRFQLLTTNTGKLKSDMGAFFRFQALRCSHMAERGAECTHRRR